MPFLCLCAGTVLKSCGLHFKLHAMTSQGNDRLGAGWGWDQCNGLGYTTRLLCMTCTGGVVVPSCTDNFWVCCGLRKHVSAQLWGCRADRRQ